ncbi:hypothetical protein DCC85_01840 [Paenibacillus sp. CAA11]|nr:hypothetical protein DCC85_01840 [Paenibacillus sp. CAA11]
MAYLKIPTLGYFQIKPDTKVIKPFLRSASHSRTLIINIHGNGGGDEAYWSRYLVSMLINKPISYHIYSIYRVGEYSLPFIEVNLQKNT